ncbi:hypothetical protein SGLAM104S_02132 [Streptomyces glaucescens]
MFDGERGPAAGAGDTLAGVVAVELRDGLIADVRVVLNPDRLGFARRRQARPWPSPVTFDGGWPVSAGEGAPSGSAPCPKGLNP